MAIGPQPLVRSQMLDLLERGLRTVVFRAYERRIGEFQQIYNMGTADKAVISDAVMFGTGQFLFKAETAPPDFDNSREAREDDLYGYTTKLADDLGESAKYTQEILAASVLNNASGTQYTAEGVNYPLLSATQYRADGGTWSNILASGADLTPESLELALIQWRTGTVDMRGQKLMLRPRYLVVGPRDEYNAKRILLSTQRAYTANNDKNVLQDLDLQLIVLTHMTDDGRWYILAGKDDHTLNWFVRRPFTVDRMTVGYGSDNLLICASYRIASPGVTGPMGIFGSL